ncbi:hypothetical protein V6N13_013448 [Hibiscus sabdariffa]|uniref:Uncharacterized protein n=1 Tax=Hibiscus sabdariffa TaxID=183260 RepID=A0ABR2BVB0_9ROSI
MLPWLVIPLIVLWALSQLLPPDFRFEITSPSYLLGGLEGINASGSTRGFEGYRIAEASEDCNTKRPVLDLPVPPGMRISNSGIIKDLVGKGGKILNGKGWSEKCVDVWRGLVGEWQLGC